MQATLLVAPMTSTVAQNEPARIPIEQRRTRRLASWPLLSISCRFFWQSAVHCSIRLVKHYATLASRRSGLDGASLWVMHPLRKRWSCYIRPCTCDFFSNSRHIRMRPMIVSDEHLLSYAATVRKLFPMWRLVLVQPCPGLGYEPGPATSWCFQRFGM